MPARAGVGQEDADLAVLRAPGRPAVLALDPRRLLPLLEEAGLVDHQDARGVAQVRHHVGAQVVAHRVRVPGGAVEELLDAVGGRVADRLGHCQPFFRSVWLSKPCR